MLLIKRIYEQAQRSDGYRVLVDRLWPRGVSKERADIDLWAKQVVPSSELRKWFDHDPARRDFFSQQYSQEIKEILKVLQNLKISSSSMMQGHWSMG